jgi:hypothetical protein
MRVDDLEGDLDALFEEHVLSKDEVRLQQRLHEQLTLI